MFLLFNNIFVGTRGELVGLCKELGRHSWLVAEEWGSVVLLRFLVLGARDHKSWKMRGRIAV